MCLAQAPFFMLWKWQNRHKVRQLGSYVRDGSPWIFAIKSSTVANVLKFRPFEEIREEQSTKIWKDQSIEVLFTVILQQCVMFLTLSWKNTLQWQTSALRACCYPRNCAHVPERNHLAPPLCWLMLVASLCLWSSAVKWNLGCSSAGGEKRCSRSNNGNKLTKYAKS